MPALRASVSFCSPVTTTRLFHTLAQRVSLIRTRVYMVYIWPSFFSCPASCHPGEYWILFNFLRARQLTSFFAEYDLWWHPRIYEKAFDTLEGRWWEIRWRRSSRTRMDVRVSLQCWSLTRSVQPCIGKKWDPLSMNDCMITKALLLLYRHMSCCASSSLEATPLVLSKPDRSLAPSLLSVAKSSPSRALFRAGIISIMETERLSRLTRSLQLPEPLGGNLCRAFMPSNRHRSPPLNPDYEDGLSPVLPSFLSVILLTFRLIPSHHFICICIYSLLGSPLDCLRLTTLDTIRIWLIVTTVLCLHSRRVLTHQNARRYDIYLDIYSTYVVFNVIIG